MDPTDLLPLLEQLDDNVDDLEEVLQPILATTLLKSSNKLPVMDKAKLHVLITYTLESLIFSYLRLHGVDAKQHPVFRELTRVKQYFEKIKVLETEPEERPMTLDKAAAGRFIKHGLAGNDKYDLERAEKQAKERARAQFKADMLARKSIESSKAQSNNDSDSDDSEGGVEVATAAEPQIDTNIAGKVEKKDSKMKSKGEHKSESSKAKKERKISKATLKEEKKERRAKKEETRKARKAQ
ncbi:Sas10/Utp3/C1D [Penicillium cf. griseofulvum]|uniref:Exosome complex protein n=1 Tax=Penicillium cf. griseofulvum TaxID=2972120 RepID=A0A9W9MZH7_9EURO|nr:Sas10/Utp3/C1D [Penicillium cf. griseofulvum]KAJ5421749.1 Sas10/Utp3/C1D [Penicillium cf. griseofulvum]